MLFTVGRFSLIAIQFILMIPDEKIALFVAKAPAKYCLTLASVGELAQLAVQLADRPG